MNNKELLVIDGISKVYGDKYVLNDISFSVLQGEIFGIVGTSGTGKSTLLKTIVGFLKPEKGDVKFRNVNLLGGATGNSAFRSVYKAQKDLKRLYGFASQNPSFYPNLTVRENLLYFGSLYGLSSDAAKHNADNLLSLVGLAQSAHLLAKSLSGGMQRRLDIACAMIHDPKILFLDEPTADLDPVLAKNIWNLLKIINQHGTTIILASHHLLDLEQAASRVLMLRDGRIAVLGRPEDIKAKGELGEQIHLQTTPGDYNFIAQKLREGLGNSVHNIEVKTGEVLIDAKKASDVVSRIVHIVEIQNERIENIEVTKPTLDTLFANLSSDTNLVTQEENSAHKKAKKKTKRKRKSTGQKRKKEQ